MKKFLSFLIIAALVVTCMATTVFAAGTLNVSSATAKTGDTVTVTVSLANNPGFATYAAYFNYDASALELQSITAGELSAGVFTSNVANQVASFINVTDVTANGTLVTATFKVLAASGSHNVTVTTQNATNAAFEAVTLGSGTGTITVEEAPHTHSWSNWTVTTPAGCETAGVETRTCSACGETETREVAAKGHSFGEWTETTAPTCTEKGEETSTCADCGKTQTREIAAKGHAYGEWTETKAPTCTEQGEKTSTCANCGEKKTEAIAALGHSFDKWGKDETHHWHICSVCGVTSDKEAHAYTNAVVLEKPTATEDGKAQMTCECGAVGETKTLPATGGQLDDVPKTGDITLDIMMMGAMLVIAMAAAGFVFKRKTAK